MHASGWIRLLRRIPPNQIENLSLVTTNTTELSIQSLVHIDEEFVLVRGRVSGSSEAGRAFFIPYDQINFLGFQKPVKEGDLQALFDGPGAWPTAAEQAAWPREGAAALPVRETAPVLEDAAVDVPPTGPAVAPRPSGAADTQAARVLPTKSKVLANLRARLQTGGGSAPNR